MCILVTCLLLRLHTHSVMYVVMKGEYEMWWVEQDMISIDKLNDLDLSTRLLGTLRNSLDLIMCERELHFIQHFEKVLLFIHHTSPTKQTPLL